MRLIDADKLKERLIAKVSGFTYKTIHIDDVVAYIDGSPTVEGESVVRCKECKWWIVAMDENNADEDYLKCNMDKWTNADDFCSYGEREGE